MENAGKIRHSELAKLLGTCSDSTLLAFLDTGRPHAVGVGGDSTIVDVEGIPIFAKRIPLTDRELAHRGSTANLFGLPMHCQYGIGGPGFNAWRELAANIIVTEGVLAGETVSFPVLHHWRVLPGRPLIADEHADIDAVVCAHGGSPAVRDRLEALAAARASLVLFSEYIPQPLADWLRTDPVSKATEVDAQFSAIVSFLRARRLLHMDGHVGNMRTDGRAIVLTDFGLATSPLFDLSAAERDFVTCHATHDADYAAMRLVNWLVTDICGVPAPSGIGPTARTQYIRRCATGDVPDDLPPVVAAILTRHAATADRMNAFYGKLFTGDLEARYPGR